MVEWLWLRREQRRCWLLRIQPVVSQIESPALSPEFGLEMPSLWLQLKLNEVATDGLSVKGGKMN